METVQFRKGEIEDLPTLYAFEQGIVAAERPFDQSLKSGHIHYYDLKEMIQSPEVDVIVALMNEEIIGSAYLKIKESESYKKHTHHGYLGFMYVRPEHRGRGVSNQIVDEVKRLAAAKNITELHLDVYEENLPALRAYEKAGFKKHLVNMRLRVD